MGSKYSKLIKIGDKFNEYTVIGEIFNDKKGYAKVKVKCSCGFEKEIDVYSLYNNKATRCYKCNKKDLANNSQWKGYKTIPGKVISKLTREAKRRNITINITIQDIYNKLQEQNGKCALTNLDVDFIKNKLASVDRIDSSKGYSIDNIQIVHKDINIMKNAFDEEHFINMCKLVSKNKE